MPGVRGGARAGAGGGAASGRQRLSIHPVPRHLELPHCHGCPALCSRGRARLLTSAGSHPRRSPGETEGPDERGAQALVPPMPSPPPRFSLILAGAAFPHGLAAGQPHVHGTRHVRPQLHCFPSCPFGTWGDDGPPLFLGPGASPFLEGSLCQRLPL